MQIIHGNAAWHVYPVKGCFEVAEYAPGSALLPRRVFEGFDTEAAALACVARRERLARNPLVKIWRGVGEFLFPVEIEDRWSIRL